MKAKTPRLLVLLCLLLAALCACAPIANKPPAPDTPDEPAEFPAAQEIYFTVHNTFVGSLTPEGKWRSVSDTSLSFEAGEEFSMGELFGQSCYTWYTQDGASHTADSFVSPVGNVPGGFFPSLTEEFDPYALEADGSGHDRFAVPTELPSDLADVTVPSYSFYMIIDEDAVLAASTERDLCPAGLVWRGDGYDVPASQDETDAVQAILQQNGISSEAFLQVVDVDYDSDGQEESFVFASTPRDEDGYQIVSEENGGTFSLVLLMDNGGTETVYSKFAPYTDDVTAMFVQRLAGPFDLDGDGVYEVCMTEGYWESAAHFVLQHQSDGTWKIVLTGVSGT